MIEWLEAFGCDPEGRRLEFVPLSIAAIDEGIYILWRQILFS